MQREKLHNLQRTTNFTVCIFVLKNRQSSFSIKFRRCENNVFLIKDEFVFFLISSLLDLIFFIKGTPPFPDPKFSIFSFLIFSVFHMLLSALYLLDMFWEFKYSFKVEKNRKKWTFFIGKQRNFVFLSRFSGNLVFEQKSAESPPFLRHGTSDRAETFYTSTR